MSTPWCHLLKTLVNAALAQNKLALMGPSHPRPIGNPLLLNHPCSWNSYKQHPASNSASEFQTLHLRWTATHVLPLILGSLKYLHRLCRKILDHHHCRVLLLPLLPLAPGSLEHLCRYHQKVLDHHHHRALPSFRVGLLEQSQLQQHLVCRLSVLPQASNALIDSAIPPLNMCLLHTLNHLLLLPQILVLRHHLSTYWMTWLFNMIISHLPGYGFLCFPYLGHS